MLLKTGGTSLIPKEAYLVDGEMAAQTGIRLVLSPDAVKLPLELCLIPDVGDAQFKKSFGQLKFGHGKKGLTPEVTGAKTA